VRAHQTIREFDDLAELNAEPTRSGWGYGFGFRDPEGNVWGCGLQVRLRLRSSWRLHLSVTAASPRGIVRAWVLRPMRLAP
jgi:hypothetical protein